jgi:hypothetical protein
VIEIGHGDKYRTDAEIYAYAESFVAAVLDHKKSGDRITIECEPAQLVDARVESTSTAPGVPCQHCGARRGADGVRTCGSGCVRGADPRAIV